MPVVLPLHGVLPSESMGQQRWRDHAWTRVLLMQVLSVGETVVEVNESGFLGTVPTLRTQLLSDDSMLQVRLQAAFPLSQSAQWLTRSVVGSAMYSDAGLQWRCGGSTGEALTTEVWGCAGAPQWPAPHPARPEDQ
jgi:hypothetical protein